MKLKLKECSAVWLLSGFEFANLELVNFQQINRSKKKRVQNSAWLFQEECPDWPELTVLYFEKIVNKESYMDSELRQQSLIPQVSIDSIQCEILNGWLLLLIFLFPMPWIGLLQFNYLIDVST